ncbi:hypothetical protein SAICODRAFT_30021 [Saitoella complicata NRRL Y-17804]|uniref:uncharacterized protein n=1 Tax=Saitoella complicata (strain BCRC 22490 / CBS 7301 / JCM 7358 / NBRC 10748 / NRRL Y-17804) TaxID=698492 RepID=UPI00086725D1|nr:uncharacterized protein SAICODRAFT_30021 [Saitoella complicata NRRL Y-17804]ODQ53691.1 hypothetical protein SAICODRAFT_30021 [Saitoella complicata NRRL Y-17804]
MTSRADIPNIPDSDGYEPIPGNDAGSPSLGFRTRLSFTWVGLAMLLCWNVFLASSYSNVYDDPIADAPRVKTYITSTFTAVNLFTILSLNYLPVKASYYNRVFVPLSILTIVFGLLFAALKLAGSMMRNTYFTAVIVTASLIAGVCTGFIQNGVFAGLAMELPEAGAYLMIGQGIAGVLPAVAEMVFLFLSSHGTLDSTSMYFGFAGLTSLFGVLAFINIGRTFPFIRQSVSAPGLSDAQTRTKAALVQLPYSAFAIVCTFAVTLSLFPAFTSSIAPASGSALTGGYFTALGFLIWNSGDVLGRTITLRVVDILSHETLAIASVMRILFLPLFVSCNVRGKGAIFPSDMYFFMVMFLFGGTNGLVSTASIVKSGQTVAADLKEATGSLVSMLVCLGLLCGSLCSFAITALFST